jgi:hypothetical protein
MKKFEQFILENIDSKIKKHDDIVTEINLDDLYGSTQSTEKGRRKKGRRTPPHPIVLAIQKLKMVGGNADLVFKINEGGIIHTVTIPPVEGNDARGRIDFTHATTSSTDNSAISRDMIELKLKSTPKTAVAKEGKLADLINRRILPNLQPSRTLRQKLSPRYSTRLLINFLRTMRENMPKSSDIDRRYLAISTVKDHGLLHPDIKIHKDIYSSIGTLPKHKQKLVHQTLRLMHERLTGIKKEESEFHVTDLDDREGIERIGSHLYDRMSFIPNSGYISVKTGNKDEHAIIRIDPQHEDQLQDQLENDLPLENNHSLHNHYVNMIKTTGQHKTTIMPSHEEALASMKKYGSSRDKIEVNTRTLPKEKKDQEDNQKTGKKQ